MTPDEMRQRTKRFTLRVMKVVTALPDTAQGRVIAYQLMKAGSSVGANYRAVCRARSGKDFVNKLGVVIEEGTRPRSGSKSSARGTFWPPPGWPTCCGRRTNSWPS